MAEPLTITLGALTGAEKVVRSILSVKRLLQEWKDAPAQILSLSSEVDDSHHVTFRLQKLTEGLTASSADSVYATLIGSQLARVEPHLNELERLLRSLHKVTGRSKQLRWMKHQGRVEVLRQRLRDLRLAQLEILNLYSLFRVEQLESTITTYQNDQGAWSEATTCTLSDILSNSIKQQIPAQQTLLDQKSNESSLSSEVGGSFVSKLAVASTRYMDFPGYTCAIGCSCRCHRGRANDTVRFNPFPAVLGSLSIAYSGWTIAGPRCDTPSCRRARSRIVQITYSTPFRPWTITVALRLVGGEPTIGLSVGKTLHPVDPSDPKSLINLAVNGNIVEMRRLLETRPGSVREIDYSSGRSALFNLFASGRFEQAAILLAAGCDPFLEDYSGTPPIYYGLVCLLQGMIPNPLSNEISRYLPFSDFFEEYGFSHIHRVVLGERPLRLSEELQKVVACTDIDAQDNMGKAPLHWAASRGDASAVEELLRAGAQVNIYNKDSRTPLYEACRGNFKQCAERLLEYGADIDARGLFGYRPMHAAATWGSAELLSLLLSHQGDMEEAGNDPGATPLQVAAYYDNVQGCRYLLDLGANIEHEAIGGDTPLITTVLRNSHGSLQLILSRKPNHLHRDHSHHTLLHHAALHGDEETLEILAAADLKGLDINAKDKKGLKARQHFAARQGTSTAHKTAFEKLIMSLHRHKGNLVKGYVVDDVGSDSDDGDLFYDAHE